MTVDPERLADWLHRLVPADDLGLTGARFDWLGRALDLDRAAAAAAWFRLGLGAARIEAGEAGAPGWSIHPEADRREGRLVITLPLAIEGRVLDLVALDPADGVLWWPLLGGHALGDPALALARQRGAPLRVFSGPLAWLRAAAEPLPPGHAPVPGGSGYCPLGLDDAALEAALAGLPALHCDDAAFGQSLADRMKNARRARRAAEPRLPEVRVRARRSPAIVASAPENAPVNGASAAKSSPVNGASATDVEAGRVAA
ncbi:hypothetical protein [Oceanibacterium hippocampi]|uniref:Uncharacterized protein n=1 Tax=Oceanibacterium hippocampi TaxID=745714 RepID=A0A1Y5U035_9PROT|nr:hypothetical protein [Oceanibacterium hippocampi]SLN77546.1 hypothetical protein OCH7691_04454 [Oceanibacterium hippocampi]